MHLFRCAFQHIPRPRLGRRRSRQRPGKSQQTQQWDDVAITQHVKNLPYPSAPAVLPIPDAPHTSSPSEPPLAPNPTVDPQIASAFFSLPLELRLTIYELIFAKSWILFAENFACNEVFRINSQRLATRIVERQWQGSLRFIHLCDDDVPTAWSDEIPESRNPRYEWDSHGDTFVRRGRNTSLMSTCRRIQEELEPLLYSRKTLVLAESKSLLRMQRDYLSPRAFSCVQHLRLYQNSCERNDDLFWNSLLQMSLRTLLISIELPLCPLCKTKDLGLIVLDMYPVTRIQTTPDVQIQFEPRLPTAGQFHGCNDKGAESFPTQRDALRLFSAKPGLGMSLRENVNWKIVLVTNQVQLDDREKMS